LGWHAVSGKPVAATGVGFATVVLLSRVVGVLVALAFSIVLSYLATLAVLDRSLVLTLIAKLTTRDALLTAVVIRSTKSPPNSAGPWLS
jgi:hypothetical protein